VTTVYRNDRSPTASRNPHGFLLDPTIAGRNLGQAQVLDFLASRGATISDPDGAGNLFEVPVADPKSIETLNFSLPPATGEPPPETARGPLPRLSLVVSPRSARSGRRTRFSFRVTAVTAGKRQAVSRASIIFAGRRVRTDARGRVRMVKRFRSPGHYRPRASREGLRAGRSTVRVVRRSGTPRFTG